MSRFDPTTSDLALIPLATLQQWQSDAVTALHQLSIGAKVVTASYSQGDGSRAVTYTPANINDLRAWLAKLNAQLGLGKGRRPMRVQF